MNCHLRQGIPLPKQESPQKNFLHVTKILDPGRLRRTIGNVHICIANSSELGHGKRLALLALLSPCFARFCV